VQRFFVSSQTSKGFAGNKYGELFLDKVQELHRKEVCRGVPLAFEKRGCLFAAFGGEIRPSYHHTLLCCKDNTVVTLPHAFQVLILSRQNTIVMDSLSKLELLDSHHETCVLGSLFHGADYLILLFCSQSFGDTDESSMTHLMRNIGFKWNKFIKSGSRIICIMG
jgi:hypothetical protein